jgi:hypothetical protein
MIAVIIIAAKQADEAMLESQQAKKAGPANVPGPALGAAPH